MIKQQPIERFVSRKMAALLLVFSLSFYLSPTRFAFADLPAERESRPVHEEPRGIPANDLPSLPPGTALMPNDSTNPNDSALSPATEPDSADIPDGGSRPPVPSDGGSRLPHEVPQQPVERPNQPPTAVVGK